jgi:hypothetical protein
LPQLQTLSSLQSHGTELEAAAAPWASLLKVSAILIWDDLLPVRSMLGVLGAQSSHSGNVREDSQAATVPLSLDTREEQRL